jgi:hypothetical protein
LSCLAKISSVFSLISIFIFKVWDSVFHLF